RNCMDITGAKRSLSLFAPEIDPNLLVRAKAAGLSLDDVLNATSGNLPPYRFTYLIEKAKSYVATVQGFGAALLGALEKKDAEELNKIRVTHQQNILTMNERIREWDIDIAAENITLLEQKKVAAENRLAYYEGLVDDGLSGWEVTQQVSKHVGTGLRVGAGVLDLLGGIYYLIPQIGSPFAMKYGGQELGHSAQTWALWMKDLAGTAEAIAGSAGLEASFHRRAQGWNHQVDVINDEINQVDTQIKTAQIRSDITIRNLEIHQENISNMEEISEFYESKFTEVGLYTWLSTTMQRLYKDAYNNAFAVAKLTEQAYRFERDDDSLLLGHSHWDASKAGLLAGTSLLVELQNMERKFIETNYRDLEIDQAFSLTQLNPTALITLKETGSCDFEVPEIYFDIPYPGHFRRKVKSVRLTIPSITGPYTNVSATLTLTGSSIRKEPQMGAAAVSEIPVSRTTSIATSSAQNDAGVFELNFRDERYMPFEGAGAVSRWRLTLPKNFRQFDYQTINDVVIHISYTAKHDGLFQENVEELNAGIEGTILNYLENNDLQRAFSLRQELSHAFNQLIHSAVGTDVTFSITDRQFPMFFQGHTLAISRAILVIK
ncbi:MAG: hypothetical protein KZQ73_16205, partial [Candidatus Thiodiazotropha sp. (ex Semelilucina semeliformis)]|nr:hypothetical protein [Candidatus Thiodiazotropha sp. (ex Semelilucina semeliformis)]